MRRVQGASVMLRGAAGASWGAPGAPCLLSRPLPRPVDPTGARWSPPEPAGVQWGSLLFQEQLKMEMWRAERGRTWRSVAARPQRQSVWVARLGGRKRGGRMRHSGRIIAS